MPAVDSSWSPDPTLEREVREQFSRALDSYRADPRLIREHANQEESIRVGGYANRTLLELVQNAADAMAGSDGKGEDNRVEIVLDEPNRTLYCANGGAPFNAKGLGAIYHAYLSDKRGDEIGRFGLGFKSVLAVSSYPQVFSRSVSFEFNTSVARQRLGMISNRDGALPILRTPLEVDAGKTIPRDPILAELAAWATTIVRLPQADPRNLARLRKEIKEFRSEFLLFVGSVREIRLRVIGPDGFETSHVSKDLGGGRLKIQRPDGSGDEWLVGDAMHRPSWDARREVGEAVSREEVKVTVAVPAEYSTLKKGEFWSYFPLQDATSASAIFNAPWSVNDDRTSLINNTYNNEILDTLIGLFVEILTRVRTADDPAAHLDYLPARGREESSFGGRALSAKVPKLAAATPIIPDGDGELCTPKDLLPLDFNAPEVPAGTMKRWSLSPNTGTDAPHWQCYTSPQRRTRLRDLCVAAVNQSILVDGRDQKRALEAMPKRGIVSWLGEWAQGDDLASAANALAFVYRNRGDDVVSKAKVIPTTRGYCSIKDHNAVFLGGDSGGELEDTVFVLEEFLRLPKVMGILQDCRFEMVSPRAIFNARLMSLGVSPSDDQLTSLWGLAKTLAPRDVQAVLDRHRDVIIKVPTRDGGWQWPTQTFDIGILLDPKYDGVVLDRERCVLSAVRRLGVITDVEPKFDLENEPLREDYKSWVIDQVNGARESGDRRIEEVDLYPSVVGSPGPVSILQMLADSGASDETKVQWTLKLLAHGDGLWSCEDRGSRDHYDVLSPVSWAVSRAGMVNSTDGPRKLDDVVAPQLIEYSGLLPIFLGKSGLVQNLDLPDSLDDVPAEVYWSALDKDEWRSDLRDGVIVRFVLAASRVAYDGGPLRRIPARVGRTVEGRPSSSVFIAVDDGQQKELLRRQKPFLRATPEEAELLASSLGCQRFEDSFSSTVVCEGQQETGPVLDVFPGLRESRASYSVNGISLIRAARITERTSTPDGVEEKALRWHADGVKIYVADDVPDGSLLGAINRALDLGLSDHELEEARKIGEAQELESYRQEALAGGDDADRLTAYFGDDDLVDALPKGLWSALEAQGMAKKMSLAELLLSVWGGDSIKQLADQFRDMGYTDVPTEWAGRPTTVAWLQRMGFGSEYAGRRAQPQDSRFIVPGAIRLSPLHDFQAELSRKLHEVLVKREEDGRALKAMLELPTGAGKTRVAVETVLRTFMKGELEGPVLWIAQSLELCEQAVQTWSTVWRGLDDERPLMVARLWGSNEVPEPDTRFSVIVATDMKLDKILDEPEYEWLWNASTVIVDEGHAAGDSTLYTRVLGRLGVDGRNWERPLVGLSATPFKGKSEERTERLARRFGGKLLSAFDENPYGELADRRVLARVDHRVLDGVNVALSAEEIDEVKQKRRLGSNVLDRVGQDDARMRILVKDILAQPWDWPILVFTPSVLSAQVLAAILRCQDVKAASVSGQTGRQERRDVIERFKNNEIQVLTNCDLLVQGFDAPGVRALYIARPTFSPNAYIQMAGRGLRGPANGGKDECQIVDMADNFGEMSQFLGFREYEELWREQS
ncbi:sacsin N-terminal ATP-binding-like domain-containing protein [Acidipropionibacterium acidipropionici]|uniref:sacsin N-terminal ATP-binding-like domain-containing protein n=1 Tax=Acidipropionibacterium acidipropionici TaxID=1748 RepID=UPI00040ADF80|nr:helicase-related protein [Acidipropionibacterium acidipropionici]